MTSESDITRIPNPNSRMWSLWPSDRWVDDPEAAARTRISQQDWRHQGWMSSRNTIQAPIGTLQRHKLFGYSTWNVLSQQTMYPICSTPNTYIGHFGNSQFLPFNMYLEMTAAIFVTCVNSQVYRFYEPIYLLHPRQTFFVVKSITLASDICGKIIITNSQ